MIAHRAADGARLALHRRGAGRPVQFQHGLGGDRAQTFESFPDLPGWALRTLDCRAHGQSAAQGPLSIARFADDVAETLPDGAVLGGISMGAAIAARLAVLHPGRLSALILVRPAWFTDPAPSNMSPVAEVAAMIARGEGPADFARTATHARLARTAPDNIASLEGFFAREPRDATARLLAAIAADGPGISAAQIAAIRLPTLVCACAEDEIHPVAQARAHADLIPGAAYVELPPKGRGKAAHLAALHDAVARFLKDI